jgi:protein-tyrosine phosphatase
MLLLGVPYEAVLQDFLASNEFVLPKYRAHLEAFAARGGEPELLMPVLSVREEYLAASLEEVRLEFGSMERYFSAGLGVGEDTQRALRERFVAMQERGAC